MFQEMLPYFKPKELRLVFWCVRKMTYPAIEEDNLQVKWLWVWIRL